MVKQRKRGPTIQLSNRDGAYSSKFDRLQAYLKATNRGYAATNDSNTLKFLVDDRMAEVEAYEQEQKTKSA